MYLKKILLLLIFFIFISTSAYGVQTMDAKKNAYIHNNKGLMYLQDKYYFGAIKEFQIAIDLNPNTQASSVFYTNLGNTYEAIGYYDLAQNCFEKALSLNVLYFDYYLKLAENYKKQNIIDEKLTEFQNKEYYPLNDIMIGLLYIQKGYVTTGITILDDFCNKEENLIITEGVRNYIDKLVKEKL